MFDNSDDYAIICDHFSRREQMLLIDSLIFLLGQDANDPGTSTFVEVMALARKLNLDRLVESMQRVEAECSCST